MNNVKMLNFFPPKGGVSDVLSPKTIMSGETLDYKKHLCLQFGQYCQVHEEQEPRNGQTARTKGAISLGPSGNLQGGYKFMALDTGAKIVRRSWDVIPMPDIVIKRVNTLGNNQPEILTFTDRQGQSIGVDKIPGVDTADTNTDEIPGVIHEPVIIDNTEIPGVTAVENDTPQQIEINDLDIPETNTDPIIEENIIEDTVYPVVPTIPAQTEQPKEPRRTGRVRTQTKAYTPSMSGTKYSFAVTQLENNGVLNPDAHMFVQEDFYQAEPDVVASIMTQLSLKVGLGHGETKLCLQSNQR